MKCYLMRWLWKRDHSIKRNETLAQYCLRVHEHLIPDNVKIYEVDEETLNMLKLK